MTNSSEEPVPPLIWHVGGGRQLALAQPQLMAILNMTPDSFSDGGRFARVSDAVDAALHMHDEGASIIDVGGESTRPGAKPVPAAEQIGRTVPLIRALRARAGAHLLISIDTTQAKVAHAALDAGANIINDVSAGTDDERMFELAASRRCGLILMHRRTVPQRDQFSHHYQHEPDYGGDVINHVRDFFSERTHAATAAGIEPQRMVIDPGLGFGKSVKQNYELIAGGGVAELQSLGFPVLCAASRKSFIGAVTGQAIPAQRVAGSVAVAVAMFMHGVRLFRVHDVAAHRAALAVVDAIQP